MHQTPLPQPVVRPIGDDGAVDVSAPSRGHPPPVAVERLDDIRPQQLSSDWDDRRRDLEGTADIDGDGMARGNRVPVSQRDLDATLTRRSSGSEMLQNLEDRWERKKEEWNVKKERLLQNYAEAKERWAKKGGEFREQAMVFFQRASEIGDDKKAQNQLVVTSIADEPPKQVTVNSEEAIEFENECFAGRMMVLVKTSDHDASNPWAEYLRTSVAGKKKTVEIQIQGRFLNEPHGTVYIGAELPRPVNVSRLAAAALRGVVSAVGSLNKNLGKMNFGLVTSRDGEGLSDEVSHTVYPLANSVDTLLVTKLDEPWPALGGTLPNIKQRVESFDTKHVYTFSLWTEYLDVLEWKLVKIPGLRTVDIRGHIQDQPIQFVVYDLLDDCDGRHLDSNKCYYCCISLHNLHANTARQSEAKKAGTWSFAWSETSSDRESDSMYSSEHSFPMLPAHIDDSERFKSVSDSDLLGSHGATLSDEALTGGGNGAIFFDEEGLEAAVSLYLEHGAAALGSPEVIEDLLRSVDSQGRKDRRLDQPPNIVDDLTVGFDGTENFNRDAAAFAASLNDRVFRQLVQPDQDRRRRGKRKRHRHGEPSPSRLVVDELDTNVETVNFLCHYDADGLASVREVDEDDLDHFTEAGAGSARRGVRRRLWVVCGLCRGGFCRKVTVTVPNVPLPSSRPPPAGRSAASRRFHRFGGTWLRSVPLSRSPDFGVLLGLVRSGERVKAPAIGLAPCGERLSGTATTASCAADSNGGSSTAQSKRAHSRYAGGLLPGGRRNSCPPEDRIPAG